MPKLQPQPLHTSEEQQGTGKQQIRHCIAQGWEEEKAPGERISATHGETPRIAGDCGAVTTTEIPSFHFCPPRKRAEIF